MTFQDPLDLTLFIQRKVLSSALPFIQRHYFKNRWIRTLQMAARTWVGFVLDYITIGILFGIYGEHLKNWNAVWKSIIGVCVSGDVILSTSFIIPLVCKKQKCPESLRNMEDRLEHSCSCNLFVIQFVCFKTLSLLQALFVVAQAVVIEGDSLSSRENIGRIVMSVIGGIDVIMNAVEIFSSGCFWCVCCIHSPEVNPDEERRRQRTGSKYGNPSFLSTRTNTTRDRDFVFTVENGDIESGNSSRNQHEEQQPSSQTEV